MILPQLAVFDMAGTTVKDNGNVADALLAAFRKMDFVAPKEEIQLVMGYKKTDAIRMLLDKFYPVQLTEGLGNRERLITAIHDRFVDEMIDFYTADPYLQPMRNAEDVFLWLKARSVKIALNSGFPRAVIDVILKRLRWNKSILIDYTIGSDEVPNGRPHPDMIYALMKKAGVKESSKVIKVGDTEVDIREGRNAGCSKVIAVTTGAFSQAGLEQYAPDHIIDDLMQIPALLLAKAEQTYAQPG
jgi:phosphonatase-like hydrolase